MKKMIKQSQELMEHGGIGMISDEDKEEETDKNKVTLNCDSATVEICDLDLTSRHHIGVNEVRCCSSSGTEVIVGFAWTRLHHFTSFRFVALNPTKNLQ